MSEAGAVLTFCTLFCQEKSVVIELTFFASLFVSRQKNEDLGQAKKEDPNRKIKNSYTAF